MWGQEEGDGQKTLILSSSRCGVHLKSSLVKRAMGCSVPRASWQFCTDHRASHSYFQVDLWTSNFVLCPVFSEQGLGPELPERLQRTRSPWFDFSNIQSKLITG